jgi:hypothetical protein
MPGDCPAALASSCGSPVENIPPQAERHSGGRQKCSPSHRNGVRLQTGMLFGITTEWCSASDRNRVRLRPDSTYNDVWQEIFPSVPGLTCCQNESDNNTVSELYQRIDLILTLGNIEGQRIALFGADPSTRTPDGLWPSDHAGVAAV